MTMGKASRTMARLRALLTLWALGIALISDAQEVRLYTADDELASSFVNDIAQDDYGFVWIATRGGLHQFDGVRWRTFQQGSGEGALRVNDIHCLWTKGQLLAGSNDGLYRLERGSGLWHDVHLQEDNPSVVALQGVEIEEHPVVVCATAGYGLFLVESDTATVARQVKWFDADYDVISMALDAHGSLWFGTTGEGIWRMKVGEPETAKCVVRGTAWQGESHVVADGQGGVYAAFTDGGLYQLDVATDFLLPRRGAEGLRIASLCPLADGSLLIGTDGQGAYSLRRGEEAASPVGYYHPRYDLRTAKVNTALQDEAGNVWLGLFQKGVFFAPQMASSFTYIGQRTAGESPIGEACVMSVGSVRWAGGDSALACGTEGDGLYVVSPEGAALRHFPAGVGGVPGGGITAIAQDSDGDLWVGAFLGGVGRLRMEDGTWTSVLEGVHVFPLLPDGQGGLWIGTLGDGLKRYDKRTGRVDEWKAGARQGGLPNMWVSSLCLSPGGDCLWVGMSSGLACLDIGTGRFRSMMGGEAVLDGLAVQHLCWADSLLCVGTNAGLVLVDSTGRTLRHFTTADGLADNNVASIHAVEGGLWVATLHGLSFWNAQAGTFRNHYTRSGLQGNEFSERATCCFGGKVYFGGTNGISALPDAPLEEEGQGKGSVQRPKLMLVDMRVSNESVTTRSLSGGKPILRQPLMEATGFELGSDDNSFVLRFSALAFGNPEAVTYQYAMDGDHWTAIGGSTGELAFTHLRPGHHTLRVRAWLGDAQSEELSLAVRIRFPWYLSWPAFLIYAIALLLVAAVFWRYRSQREAARRKLKAEQRQQELNEAKMQFFISLNHEIRTPMTLVMGPLQNLLNSDDDPMRQRIYRLMSRNAERILAIISQILDMRRIDKGQLVLQTQRTDMVALVRDTCDLFYSQAIEQGLALSFHAEGEEVWAMADTMNFDKVVMNLLSNAFKYTPRGGHVVVEVRRQGEEAVISVRDDGQGIDPAQMGRIFQRFYRDEQGGNHQVTGSGIGLHLTKQLVELHGGSISVANNSDAPGCTFTVRLPLATEAPHSSDPTTQLAKEPQPIVVDYEAPEECDDAQGGTRGKRPRVVIVEDDAEIRQYLREQLAAECRITECRDGREGLAEILREPPALVVSDVMMPEMDGYTLCAKIKTNIHTNDVPVILLTAMTQERDRLQGLSTGADAYVGKPFNIDILRQHMHNLIAARRIQRNKAAGNERAEGLVEEVSVPNRDDELLQRVVKVINENIDNPELSVEMLADKVGISRAHLHRRLKELTNQGARDFIRNLRLERAAKQLAEGGGTVADVMYACGFDNPASFSTKFKTLYGMSPTEYMKQHRKQPL